MLTRREFLGSASLFALARRLGAKPDHAIYAPAFYLLSRPIVEQAVGADVDLICAAMFLTSLYLGIIAVDTDERRDWVLWGISLGLYWGSKYVSLVYTPVLLLLPLMRGPRLKALWALPGILLFAMPWYLRVLEISRPLHFGDYGGMPLKIIWMLLDIATILVLGSGIYLWLSRRSFLGAEDTLIASHQASALSPSRSPAE